VKPFTIAQWDESNTDGKWLLTCLQNVGKYLPFTQYNIQED